MTAIQALAPDILLLNAKVLTADRAFTIAQALAIKDGRILAVGPDEVIKGLAGEGTAVLSLGGRTVIPGIIDAHNHLLSTGFTLKALRLYDCRSVGDIQAMVAERARRLPKGAWITGRGWDETLLREGRPPTRWELDEAAPEHPVALERVWNKLVANSLALRQAGISRETADPPSDLPYAGRIGRDQAGEPTGLFTDRAKRLILQAGPKPDLAEMEDAIVAACRAYNAVGITSVVDPGQYPLGIRAFQGVGRQGNLTVRTSVCPAGWGFGSAEDDGTCQERFEHLGLTTGFGNDLLRIDAIKIMPDGGVGDRTAWMSEPYQGDPNNYGTTVIRPDEIPRLVEWCHRRGWSVEAHTCGDRTQSVVVGAYARAYRLEPSSAIRHRIHHGYLPAGETLTLMAEHRIPAITNPPFIYYLGESYITNLGRERATRMKPHRRYLDAGVPLAGSSDSPVVDYNPFVGLYAGVARRTHQGTPFTPVDRLTREEALRLYTSSAA